ncbi:MAG TPA: GatB/YqeY domain-containing protein [Xanthobacteraceae bacterium]|nr:GatB/YqeY domain-containing protein [Xanthobacteraceae bacterium]
MLRDEINAALRAAMKARDQRRVDALRLVNSAIQNADIEATRQGKAALSDTEVLALLQKLIRQRQESAEIYDKSGRAELAAKERAEIEIISAYLPKPMSDLEAGAAIAAIVREINAQGMKDMGRVMAALKERFAGRLDFAKASAKVKELLKS